MATLGENISRAISNFNDIKTALNNGGIISNGPTSEYADNINNIINNYYYEDATNTNFIKINNHLDYLANYTIYGNAYQEASPTIDNKYEPYFVGERTNNLFDYDTISNGYIDNSSGIFMSSDKTIVSDFIEVESDTTYSFIVQYEELAATSQRSIVMYDSNKDMISGYTYVVSTNTTINTSSTTKYIRISTDKNCTNIMLIKGTTLPNEFIPYGYEIPIKTIGKNLLKNNCVSSNTKGIDITVNNDGSITLDKTSSDICTININTEFELDINQQYKLIYEGDTLPSGVYLSIRQKNSENIIADLSTTKVKKLNNINESISGIFKCYIYIPNGTTFDNITIKPMVTLVENDNTYEQYNESISKLYLKEPLCKVDNIMDVYDYQTNTILRKIKKIIFNDASVLSSVVGPNTDGWYYTSYTLNNRNYDPEINTSIYNGFIVDNMDARCTTPAYVGWSSASASVFRIYVKDTYINTFEGETIQDKLISFINQHPFTIWYPTTNVIEEHLLNCNICKIYNPSKEKYGLLNIQTSLNPSKVVIKYNKSSDLATAVSKIEDVMRNNNIDFSDNNINEYADLIDYSLQNSINLQPDPVPADVPYKDYAVQVEISNISVLPTNAFNGFVNLKGVKLSTGLTEIGAYAFYGCTSLLEIDVPASVVSIGEKAIGYDGNGELINGFVLYGQYGTAAEEYAQENGINFMDKNAAFAYEVEPTDNTATITAYSGSNRKVIIPQYLDGLRVRRIYANVFTSTTIYHLNARGIYGFIDVSNTGVYQLPSTLEFLYLSNVFRYMTYKNNIFLELCSQLSNIVLEKDFDFALDCHNCPLTHDCLVNMLLNLKDRSELTAKTLTLGSTNLAKLSNAEKAIATQKNWTLA